MFYKKIANFYANSQNHERITDASCKNMREKMRHDMLFRFFRVNLRSNCRLTLKKISIFAIYIPDIFHKKAIKADFSVLMAFGEIRKNSLERTN